MTFHCQDEQIYLKIAASCYFWHIIIVYSFIGDWESYTKIKIRSNCSRSVNVFVCILRYCISRYLDMFGSVNVCVCILCHSISIYLVIFGSVNVFVCILCHGIIIYLVIFGSVNVFVCILCHGISIYLGINVFRYDVIFMKTIIKMLYAHLEQSYLTQMFIQNKYKDEMLNKS